MNTRFTRPMLACALVAACVPATMSAHSRPPVPSHVDILVNGTVQPRLERDGRVYVEALKGREYEIRLRNPYPVRVAVALSVDGLNTIDARETTAADARKWVLGPYQTVTIRGWQTSPSEARRFEFTTEARSYGRALGHTANLGIISAVFFKERSRYVSRERTEQELADRRAGSAPTAPAPSAAPRAEESSVNAQRERADEDYAATGMGRRTDHAVTRVWLDLENTPAHTVNIRYEFRAQLVRLGILPAREDDALRRREGARGFSDFAPVR
jgi:hypothetical protein